MFVLKVLVYREKNSASQATWRSLKQLLVRVLLISDRIRRRFSLFSAEFAWNDFVYFSYSGMKCKRRKMQPYVAAASWPTDTQVVHISGEGKQIIEWALLWCVSFGHCTSLPTGVYTVFYILFLVLVLSLSDLSQNRHWIFFFTQMSQMFCSQEWIVRQLVFPCWWYSR